jgi:peptidyl-prolyl cis-trans isomerase C
MKVDGIEVPDALVVAETRRLVLALGQRLPSENLARHADRIRDQARQLALGRHLLLEEAVRQGIEISPAEVEEDLDRVRRACGTPKAFEEHLRRLEATPESLRQTLAEARQVDELTRRLTADIPEPSESELQAFYDEHAGDFAEPERARVRHILIRTDPKDQAGRPTALARIRALFDQLASGLASFEDLAREHSDCPSGRETGGDLGWIRRGQMPGPFEDAALSLEPGAVSQPVETPYGFHLIRVEERQPARSVPFEEARDRIRERLRDSARNTALQEAIGRLREAALQGKPA